LAFPHYIPTLAFLSGRKGGQFSKPLPGDIAKFPAVRLFSAPAALGTTAF